MENLKAEIRRLPQEIVRLIAAGEVIERPASVVKELIENSLDAGTGHIEIKLINGGLTSITVRDDGSGIPAEQVPRLLERHTTSKIFSEDDLNAIHTLGFRGEALYSIAAVCDLVLSTLHSGEEAGTRLTWENGERKIETIPWPGGTQVESLRIFHSTPARRKFLRASSAEYTRVAELVQAYALAYSDISWTLIHNGRETLRSPGTGNLEDAIIAVYGVEIAKKMLPVQLGEGHVSVTGAVSAMDLTRARRTDQVIFLNGRLIKDPSIGSAIARPYQPFMPPKRHPVAILKISCDPEQVDVNVHPHKREVRLANPRSITHVVFHAIKNALIKNHPLEFGQPSEPVQTPGQTVSIDEITGEVISTGPSSPPLPPTSQAVTDREEEKAWGVREPKHHHDASLPEYGIPGPPHKDSHLQSNVGDMIQHRYPTFEEIGVMADSDEPGDLFQFADTFIVYRKGGTVYLVDQHNLHERILYENFRKRDESSPGLSQALLFPMQVTLPPALSELVESHKDELNKLGFELEEFSEGGRSKSFVLRAVPQELRDADPVQALTDCLEMAGQNEDIHNPDTFRRAFSINLACKSAIKAGTPLTEEEMRFLTRHVDDGTFYTCPHGRPTIIKLDEDWLRRAFKRT